MALATIVMGVLLVVPTAYWVRLRLPQVRPYVEFITLLPLIDPRHRGRLGLYPAVTTPRPPSCR